MTLTLKFTDTEQIEELILYLDELYDYINLDKKYIPALITTDEDTVMIYMSDDFFKYSYQYFMNELILRIANQDNETLEKLAKGFRFGAEDFLMNTVII